MTPTALLESALSSKGRRCSKHSAWMYDRSFVRSHDCGFQADNQWDMFLAIFVYAAVLRIAAYMALKFKNWIKR